MTATHQIVESESSPRRRNAKVVLSLLVAVALQLALVAAWAGAMGKPALHHEPVGLVVAAGARVSAAGIVLQPADAVDWQPLQSQAAASRAVRRGELAGALTVVGTQETLMVASAGGSGITDALTTLLGAQARTAGLQLQVADVRPLSPGDPRGLGIFVLVLGWVIGGYAGAMLLLRALGPATHSVRGVAVLLGWQAAYAVIAAAFGTLLIDPLLGMISGHPAQLLAVGALLIFAVATFALAMLSLLGNPGLIVAIAGLLILGNPASGGLVPSSMLPSGWHFLAEIMPNTAGVHLVRSVTYFGGHGISNPLIVLISYAGLSVLTLVALAARRGLVAGQVPVELTPVEVAL
jgi:hypothetical protein